jgi:broad specificity phosphatase PhoE
MFSGPDDRLRPLTVEGRHQTAELVGTLADLGANRVLSSPYRRCMETAAPLAAHLGVELEVVRELEEGTAVGALALVRELAAESAALFSHGDIIPAVLDALARDDELDLGPEPRCQKASVWILEPDSVGPTFISATYVPPPHWTKG